jgi:hypothetical protein
MVQISQVRSVGDQGAIPEGPRYAQYGLALGRPVLRALEKRGIYCHTGVSIEHQHLAKRYVLRGTESGGAVSDMGRYCAYLDGEGQPLSWLQPLDSIAGNGRHAIVIATELLRVDMLRVGRTYDLAISRHTLLPTGEQRRPAITSALLFRGHQGTLAVELWKEEHRKLRGSLAPVFYTPAGEMKQFPQIFDEAVKRVTGALSCLGCRHAHIAAEGISSSSASVWESPHGSA